MPRLSVLVPAYNAAETIASALRSTLAALPRDAEIVVLDDGSSDATADVSRATSDTRVRVISRSNAGVAATLTELLAVTDSELVARMDADDLVLPGRLRRQLRAIESGADAVFTTVVTFGSGVPGLPRPSGIAAAEFGLHLLLTNPVAHSTMLARRSTIEAAGGYRPIPTEDYDLWLRMATQGARLRRLALPGLAYRVHPGQVTASAEWRRSSWENEEIAEAYSALAEKLIGAPATRITSLSIDDTLTAAEKRTRVAEFSSHFEDALSSHPAHTRRALRRKLAERRRWLDERLTKEQVIR
jgi:glycosyltransferase involved in cell wall biosynthesis